MAELPFFLYVFFCADWCIDATAVFQKREKEKVHLTRPQNQDFQFQESPPSPQITAAGLAGAVQIVPDVHYDSESDFKFSQDTIGSSGPSQSKQKGYNSNVRDWLGHFWRILRFKRILRFGEFKNSKKLIPKDFDRIVPPKFSSESEKKPSYIVFFWNKFVVR